MSEADPEAPPATPSAPPGEPSADPPPPDTAPLAAPPTPPRSAAWLGIVAVALGALVMVGGVVSIYLYVKALPPRPSLSAALPPPLPPEVLPTPSPSVAPTTPGSGSVPSSPPVALAPFKEDAAALVPVERGRPLWGPQNSPVTLTLFGDFECPFTIAMLRVILAEKAR